MKCGITLSEWKTPNTYDANYSSLPEEPGVYLLVLRKFIITHNGIRLRNRIAYVGSSYNLAKRLRKHPMINKILDDLNCEGYSIACYFKPCTNYRSEERSLIKETQARWNKQWR